MASKSKKNRAQENLVALLKNERDIYRSRAKKSQPLIDLYSSYRNLLGKIEEEMQELITSVTTKVSDLYKIMYENFKGTPLCIVQEDGDSSNDRFEPRQELNLENVLNRPSPLPQKIAILESWREQGQYFTKDLPLIFNLQYPVVNKSKAENFFIEREIHDDRVSLVGMESKFHWIILGAKSSLLKSRCDAETYPVFLGSVSPEVTLREYILSMDSDERLKRTRNMQKYIQDLQNLKDVCLNGLGVEIVVMGEKSFLSLPDFIIDGENKFFYCVAQAIEKRQAGHEGCPLEESTEQREKRGLYTMECIRRGH